MAKKIGKFGMGINTGASAAKMTTPVRNTAVPKMPVTKREVTQEMIAKRAYEIWQSGKGGSEVENWLRAERELRAL
jgi:hypothetical protein